MTSGTKTRRTKYGEIRWYGAQVKKQIRQEMHKRLQTVGVFMEAQIKLLIGTKFTKVLGPSAPGEAPHRWKGRLTQSIFWANESRKNAVRGKLSIIVGTPLKYGLFLELGTVKMEKRPYLRASLIKHRMKINQILSAPIAGVGVRGSLTISNR